MSKRFLVAVSVAFVALTTPLSAIYYQDTLFPVGLTGLNYTGGDTLHHQNCPFGNEGWTWDKERNLIQALGINVIGCEDAYPAYLMDLKPTSPNDPDPDNRPSENNYLHQVCVQAPANKPVYIIPDDYYATAQFWNYQLDKDFKKHISLT